MKLIHTTCVALAALLLAVTAGAQRFGGGGFFSDAVSLARRSDVQTELKLTSDQKTKLKDVGDKVQQERRDLFQNSDGDFQGVRDEMKKKQPAWEKQVFEILTADQQKRLKELVIQRAGTMAVYQEDVQKGLALTDDQKTKLKDLQKKQMEAMQSVMEKMQNQELSQDEMREAMQKNQKTMEDGVNAILTADQKTKFKALGGTPFKFDEDNFGGA